MNSERHSPPCYSPLKPCVKTSLTPSAVLFVHILTPALQSNVGITPILQKGDQAQVTKRPQWQASE